IDSCEQLSQEQINDMDSLSTKQVKERFSWDFIVDEYEKLFKG
ncbi:glycosyltransferase family 1 protein, partial [Streptococcus suis]|nr:glycosyltransferase family 1 protein [Streptococcus suis]